jgi:hypothetical protein
MEAEMTNIGTDLGHTSISPIEYSSPAVRYTQSYQLSLRFESYIEGSIEALRKILRKLAREDLPGKKHIEGYLRHMARSNRRPRTMYGRWETILIFIRMIKDSGKTRLEEITRKDVEAFIEHE